MMSPFLWMLGLWPFTTERDVDTGYKLTKGQKIRRLKIELMEQEIEGLKKEQEFLKREQEYLEKINELTDQLAEQNESGSRKNLG